MTSDTLWQKYIYDMPFDDNEMPLLNSRMSVVASSNHCIMIPGKALYALDENKFVDLCKHLFFEKIENIIIKNDYEIKSKNQVIENAAKAHMMSFCHLFQENGFHCRVDKYF